MTTKRDALDADLSDGFDTVKNADVTLSLIQEGTKLRTLIGSKTTELEKAKTELTLSDKDDKYKRYLLEQKTRLYNSSEKKQDTLDERLEGKEDRIADEIDQLEKRKELLYQDYQRNLTLIEAKITRLKHKEADVKRKIEKQKSEFDKEKQDKLRYYDDELKRLHEGVASTPKIRSLEVDLTNLWEKLNQNEMSFFKTPTPITVMTWSRDLPSSIQQLKTSLLENASKPNPKPAPKPEPEHHSEDEDEGEIIEHKLPEPEPTLVDLKQKADRMKIAEKKGCLLVDDSESEEEIVKPKTKKPISISSASTFGNIIQSTKRVSSK